MPDASNPGRAPPRARRARLVAAGLSLLLAPIASAGGGPDNVTVVVNGDSWASLTVANEYVRLRGIPPGHVVVLDGVRDFENADVDTFRKSILAPVLETLERRGLRAQIDFVAYSCDLPYCIDLGKDAKDRHLPQVITLKGSANGLTFLHEDVLARRVGYLRLDANRYMRRPLPLREATVLSDREAERNAAAEALCRDKKWSDALPVYEALAKAHPSDAGLAYNLACCLAREGKADAALAALKAAVANGWRNARHTAGDEDLAALRERDDFKRLVADMTAVAVQTQPATALRASLAWDDRGQPGPHGPHYLISTFLGVTSGRGSSVREVLECLRRSAAADATHPNGTVYYMRNGDIRSGTREWGFESAVAALAAHGVAACVNDGVVPRGRQDVMGAMIGAADVDWPASGSRILPGAIVEHLTSFGGMLGERAGQTPCTEFIRHGAAGTSGTVTEPYAIAEKFPSPFIHAHYAAGCSLGEAFYQSVHGPYQLLIIGDPLVQPWAQRGRVSLTGFEAGATLSGLVSLGAGIAQTTAERFELYVDGRWGHGLSRGTILPGEHGVTLDTTALPDGWHELSVVAIGPAPIETQSRLVVPFAAANRGRGIEVRECPKRIVWGETLRISLRAEGARRINILHLGRPVGGVSGDAGVVSVPTPKLGLGPVRLVAVASAGIDQPADGVSAPIDVTVEEPGAIPSRPPPAGATLAKGLLLRVKGRDPVVVEDTTRDDWLTKAGVAAGAEYALEGYFDAAADLYQLQWRSESRPAIEVSGVKVDGAAGPGFHFAPLLLEAGPHRLLVAAKAGKAPRLNLRLGARGAATVGGATWRCVVR